MEFELHIPYKNLTFCCRNFPSGLSRNYVTLGALGALVKEPIKILPLAEAWTKQYFILVLKIITVLGPLGCFSIEISPSLCWFQLLYFLVELLFVAWQASHLKDKLIYYWWIQTLPELRLARRRNIHKELLKFSELVHWMKNIDPKVGSNFFISVFVVLWEVYWLSEFWLD